ncbi:MAG: DUF4476 domain-containing protein [Myxococcota bacterium]
MTLPINRYAQFAADGRIGVTRDFGPDGRPHVYDEGRLLLDALINNPKPEVLGIADSILGRIDDGTLDLESTVSRWELLAGVHQAQPRLDDALNVPRNLSDQVTHALDLLAAGAEGSEQRAIDVLSRIAQPATSRDAMMVQRMSAADKGNIIRAMLSIDPSDKSEEVSALLRAASVNLLRNASANQFSAIIMRLADPSAFTGFDDAFETDDGSGAFIDAGNDPNYLERLVFALSGERFEGLAALANANFLDMTPEAQALFLHYGVTKGDWALQISSGRAEALGEVVAQLTPHKYVAMRRFFADQGWTYPPVSGSHPVDPPPGNGGPAREDVTQLMSELRRASFDNNRLGVLREDLRDPRRAPIPSQFWGQIISQFDFDAGRVDAVAILMEHDASHGQNRAAHWEAVLRPFDFDSGRQNAVRILSSVPVPQDFTGQHWPALMRQFDFDGGRVDSIRYLLDGATRTSHLDGIEDNVLLRTFDFDSNAANVRRMIVDRYRELAN